MDRLRLSLGGWLGVSAAVIVIAWFSRPVKREPEPIGEKLVELYKEGLGYANRRGDNLRNELVETVLDWQNRTSEFLFENGHEGEAVAFETIKYHLDRNNSLRISGLGAPGEVSSDYEAVDLAKQLTEKLRHILVRVTEAEARREG